MRLWRWFPWRYLISRAARGRGLIDPVRLLSRLERLGQPIEVKEPLELLRSGLVLHARGLLNAGVIQHNLDWIWPYWVERQYDPHDDAFVPRAFSLTHINLTHRNWTAVGLPGCDELPIVDPRGLVTPFWDGWSLDAWLLAEDGRRLVPARVAEAAQRLDLGGDLAVETRTARPGLELAARTWVEERQGVPTCCLGLAAASDAPAWLAVALRPYNPEGVSFVHRVREVDGGTGWRIDERREVRFGAAADRLAFSDYRSGDVQAELPAADGRREARCEVGMATAAALFAVPARAGRRLEVAVPLAPERAGQATSGESWESALAGAARLAVPDRLWQQLYDAALRTLVLHSGRDVYPGPFTYKRFWFRDAAFILHALACAGLPGPVERALDRYPARQTRDGFFRSQEGEWDANGAALWTFSRYCRLTGQDAKPQWRQAIARGAEWIIRHRRPRDGSPHAGLLPAGFSAEHLGPVDYYYWDDFWGAGGLAAAARLAASWGDEPSARRWQAEGESLLATVAASLERGAGRRGRPAMPASPYRRLDGGAVGSLAAGYPLALWPADDPRLLDTARFLCERFLVGGAFFLDLIHSGINAYLTLHIAQVLLRGGEVARALDLAAAVARLASPTGQWPEAIHPATGGGCMGDGQHAWAAAEWALLVRHLFLREEGEALVVAPGLPASWLEGGATASFGPAPTPWGEVTVTAAGRGEGAEVAWRARWRGGGPARVELRLPGFAPADLPPAAGGALLTPLHRAAAGTGAAAPAGSAP